MLLAQWWLDVAGQEQACLGAASSGDSASPEKAARSSQNLPGFHPCEAHRPACSDLSNADPGSRAYANPLLHKDFQRHWGK